MNVRNFWIEANIDGRATTLEGGPRSKDGGFSLSIKMRDAGGISKPVTIQGRALADGTLILAIDVKDVYEVQEFKDNHPPRHDATIQVRTHRNFAVRAGTEAAKGEIGHHRLAAARKAGLLPELPGSDQ